MTTTEQRDTQLVIEDRGEGLSLTLVAGDQGNYLGLEELTALTAALERAEASGKRWVLLQQRGRDFCLGRAPEISGPEVRDALIGVVQRMQKLELITVAAADGGCVGFGVGLFALNDVSLASDRAWFQFPEILHGAAPAIVASWLYDRVPYKQGLYWTLTGAKFEAQEALDFGLATRIVPADQLPAATEETLALLDGIPQEQLRKNKGAARVMSAAPRDLALRRAVAVQWFR